MKRIGESFSDKKVTVLTSFGQHKSQLIGERGDQSANRRGEQIAHVVIITWVFSKHSAEKSLNVPQIGPYIVPNVAYGKLLAEFPGWLTNIIQLFASVRFWW